MLFEVVFYTFPSSASRLILQASCQIYGIIIIFGDVKVRIGRAHSPEGVNTFSNESGDAIDKKIKKLETGVSRTMNLQQYNV